MTTVYFVRHAEAEGNTYRRMHGQYNSLITENGVRQIEALRARFEDIPVDACYAAFLGDNGERMPRCGLEPGCGMGAAQPGGTGYAISNFMAFILFIIYEKGRKFNVLFRQDIPTNFVQ